MIEIINGNALALPIASGTVQCCVTSPPYLGLRDYQVAGQIGLEQTPAEYVAQMVAVFREVWRVLRDDGTCWINLGDSYAGSTQTGGTNSKEGSDKRAGRMFSKPANHGYTDGRANRDKRYSVGAVDCAKPKDLLGIPWRVAFALQDDGWYLRSDIIWHKPNPMPESVTDRPTKSHEYIFLMAKRAKYYYDAEAVKEPSVEVDWQSRYNRDSDKSQPTDKVNGIRLRPSAKRGDFNGKSNELPGREAFRATSETRNRRTVWTIPSQPYSGAHFATYPEKLVEPCILAGSKPGDIVLDPFNGSGTTGRVAARHNRQYIGVELNPEYIKLNPARLTVQSTLM